MSTACNLTIQTTGMSGPEELNGLSTGPLLHATGAARRERIRETPTS